MTRTPLSTIDGNRLWLRNEIRNGRSVIAFYTATLAPRPILVMLIGEEHIFDGDGNYFDNDLPVTEVKIDD